MLYIKRKKSHTIYLQETQSDLLNKLANDNKCTKSQIVESLINKYFEEELDEQK